MKGFIIETSDKKQIRFKYYDEAAPLTVMEFSNALPFKKSFYHARVSGLEIWIDDAPELNIPQENASVFTEPGEVVIGPKNPSRNKTAKCMGIYYGEGKGLDACNIFAKVFEEDLSLLKDLGNKIWREGVQELKFEKLV
ncbi:MAG TPA: DUF3830 family protein [Chitinophagaceae bacterium]|nr:DUF3830 family protein [Chitinophagaceae bacterium]